MSGLKIGDRVRDHRGTGVVTGTGMGRRGDGVHVLYISGSIRGDTWLSRTAEPLPPDIPRERVADLHAAVTKRLEQLHDEAKSADDIRTRESAQDCHAELSEVAEALRLLLEGGDDA